MFFLRKRREKLDQEAGLIFRWRGSKQYHVGKLLALVLASVFFVFAVYAIRIDVGSVTPLSKRTGKVFMINENDPNSFQLLVQIEDRSPFHRRWDPAHDHETMGRVRSKVDSLAGYMQEYKPELRVLPVTRVDRELPSVLQSGGSLTGDAVRTWSLAGNGIESARGPVFVRARITADKKIAQRIGGRSLSLPSELIAEEWYGQTYSFLISVDEKGVITDCLPLSGESLEVMKPMKKEKLLARWLRSQRLEPAAGNSVLRGKLELHIEALRKND